MLICKGVVYRHIPKVGLHILFKERCDHLELEARIDEYRSDVSLNHVWQALVSTSEPKRVHFGVMASYLRRVLGGNPVVHCTFTLAFCSLNFLGIMGDLRLQRVTEVSKMSLQAKLHGQSPKEFV